MIESNLTQAEYVDALYVAAKNAVAHLASLSNVHSTTVGDDQAWNRIAMAFDRAMKLWAEYKRASK